MYEVACGSPRLPARCQDCLFCCSSQGLCQPCCEWSHFCRGDDELHGEGRSRLASRCLHPRSESESSKLLCFVVRLNEKVTESLTPSSLNFLRLQSRT